MPDAQLKVFISYSHNDRKWLDRLLIHLKPLSRDYNIDIWSDKKIKPGSKWKEEIATAVENCDVAILLISADFLASDFIYTDELPPLLNAAENEGKLILSVIVSPCLLTLNPSLSQIQSINEPDKPLLSLINNEQESVFVKVTETVFNRANKINSELNNNDGRSEDFLNFIDWQKLIKLGNWMFDESNKTIIGSGTHSYLVSRKSFGQEDFEIKARVTYTNLKLFGGRQDFINTGIIFGWETEQSKPTYYNLLFTGKRLILEKVGNKAVAFMDENVNVENYEHLDKGIDFDLLENFDYNFIIHFTKKGISVLVNNKLQTTFKLPTYLIGRVGIRAWRCQVNLHEFKIKQIENIQNKKNNA